MKRLKHTPPTSLDARQQHRFCPAEQSINSPAGPGAVAWPTSLLYAGGNAASQKPHLCAAVIWRPWQSPYPRHAAVTPSTMRLVVSLLATNELVQAQDDGIDYGAYAVDEDQQAGHFKPGDARARRCPQPIDLVDFCQLFPHHGRRERNETVVGHQLLSTLR
jgi:hypothetical protein